MYKKLLKPLCLILLGFSISAAYADKNVIKQNSDRSVKNAATRDYWPTEGWKKSTPQKQDFDTNLFSKAETRFKEIFPGATSIIIVRHGYVVLEEYFNGWDSEKSLHIYSITKTVMGALTGICIKEGYIDSVDRKIMDFFPEYFTDKTDPGKKNITLKQALTHSTGLDDKRKSENADWLTGTLDENLINTPGEKFSYNNTVPDLFPEIIKRKSGMDAKTLAQKYLFTPLGISLTKWNTFPDGSYQGAGGLYLTPRDMAKLGYLYLNDGVWDNKRILPAGWVKESSYPQIQTDNKAYGYYLWVRPAANNKTENGCPDLFTYYAYGHRGQYIGVIPELDTVVVITTDENDTSRDNFYIMELIQNYLEKYFIPSVNK